jgi:transposase
VPSAIEIARRPSYAELEALVAGQARRIVELEALVAELRARLDQNSGNSSKPPSSDGYTKQPAEKNKKRSLRRRSGRKPGGQPGHRGHHLERREDPDRTELHEVKICECCGRDLSGAPIEQSQSRQVFDLPEMPALECVEHWIQMRPLRVRASDWLELPGGGECAGLLWAADPGAGDLPDLLSAPAV